MPVTPTFPGIYIEELPSSAHTVTAAPTSVAVFIGYSHPLKTDPADLGKPVQVFGFTDYERKFGGFFRSTAFEAERADFGDLAQAVNQFFLNGGSDAYVVALAPKSISPVTGARATLGPLRFTAREFTDAEHRMTVAVSVPGGVSPPSPPAEQTADVTVTYGPPGGGRGTVTETYRQVSLAASDPDGNANANFVGTRVADSSSLVEVEVDASSPPQAFAEGTRVFPDTPGVAAALFDATDFTAVFQQDTPLDKLAIFNLLVVPGVTNSLVMNAALAFCERKRAFLIMDPPITTTADATNKIQDTISGPAQPKGKNGALYFPYLKSPDPLTGLSRHPVTGVEFEVPPSGTVAGIFARTDTNRGVWKAPAGLQATAVNTTGVVERGRMTDQRHGTLNPLGVNVLRDFPDAGTVVFGARTLVTKTEEQWRYVPVRRMALFLEQTLYANLGWVVFEPNDEPLWSAIRNSIDAFMLGLFRQGAFQGGKPSDAFLVKCDSQTTTQADINNGIVNIVVAFAPLKPAEFVIIKIAQLAGQTQA